MLLSECEISGRFNLKCDPGILTCGPGIQGFYDKRIKPSGHNDKRISTGKSGHNDRGEGLKFHGWLPIHKKFTCTPLKYARYMAAYTQYSYPGNLSLEVGKYAMHTVSNIGCYGLGGMYNKSSECTYSMHSSVQRCKH